MPRYFSEDHEWIEVEGNTATVGITDYAQGQLGDIVFAEVPAVVPPDNRTGTAMPRRVPRASIATTSVSRSPVESF